MLNAERGYGMESLQVIMRAYVDPGQRTEEKFAICAQSEAARLDLPAATDSRVPSGLKLRALMECPCICNGIKLRDSAAASVVQYETHNGNGRKAYRDMAVRSRVHR